MWHKGMPTFTCLLYRTVECALQPKGEPHHSPPCRDGIQRGRGGRARALGVEFDGHTLALTGGGVLYALGSPSYAAVSEVRLSHVDFQQVGAGLLKALESYYLDDIWMRSWSRSWSCPCPRGCIGL